MLEAIHTKLPFFTVFLRYHFTLILLTISQQCSRPYNCCEAEPACTTTNSTVLLHTAVPGNATTQHYLLGTAGYPTILMAQSGTYPGKCTNNLWTLSVNLSEYISSQKEGSVKFGGDFSFEHDYSFALIFRSLVQFNVYDSEANDSFCSNCFSPGFWSSESFTCNHTMQTYSDVDRTGEQTYCVRPFTDITWGYVDGTLMSGEQTQEFAGNDSARIDLKVCLFVVYLSVCFLFVCLISISIVHLFVVYLSVCLLFPLLFVFVSLSDLFLWYVCLFVHVPSTE